MILPGSRLNLPLGLLLALLSGCSSVYYNTMEKLGYEKRDLLVDRVEDARAAQEAAREQFASALDQFIAATNFQGGDLEAAYRRLNAAYAASERRANAVRERIDRVEKVAGDLFSEWEDELELYTDRELPRQRQAAGADPGALPAVDHRHAAGGAADRSGAGRLS